MIEALKRENKRLKEELEKARRQCLSLEEERRSWNEEKESLLWEQKILKQKIDDLLRRIYGRKSEKTPPGQLYLPWFQLAFEAQEEVEKELRSKAEDVEEAPAPPPRPRKKRKHNRRPIPENLPRKREEIPPRPEDLTCERCGRKKVRIGEEKTEELDIIPSQLFVREIVRGKYACPCCRKGVTVPELPPRPIEKGRPGPGLLAHVVVSKFADHLPLYRQEQIFARQGVDLPRSTLCDWISTMGSLLQGIVKEMKRYILKSPVVQSDDTPIQYRENGVEGKTLRGYIWAYGIPWGEVVYEFRRGRARAGPLEFFGNYKGYIQTDGFGGYNALFEKEGVFQIACMAHIRRYFYNALEEAPDEARAILAGIQKLYRIEREAKAEGITGSALVELRRERALPILNSLWELFEYLKERVRPKSRLGKAVRYALGQWEAIKRYTEIAEAEIDNNSIENAMRAVVLGRKNWLFLGNADRGGRTAVVFYSLVVSCKRLGIDPFEYLKDVIDRIPIHPASRIWELTPRGWKEAREASAQKSES